MARAHRIGQKSHVSVYRFVSKDTMEEDVLERAKKKMVLEYASESGCAPRGNGEIDACAVINQMDTSQAHLSSKATTKDASKPNDLSKEELHAVLKYGAQKMYVHTLSHTPSRPPAAIISARCVLTDSPVSFARFLCLSFPCSIWGAAPH